MPQIRPITDLRNASEISAICHASREPVFITKNGYTDMVVMSIETHEAMVESAAMDTAIVEAEAAFEAGWAAPRHKGSAGLIKEEVLWINAVLRPCTGFAEGNRHS